MKAVLLMTPEIVRQHYVAALLGIGLSYGLTSGKKVSDLADDPDTVKKLSDLATRLGSGPSNGEDKYLRQIPVVWDIRAPLFWWSEMDTYKVGTTTQSESTMHTLLRMEEFTDNDFEYPVGPVILDELNRLLKTAKDAKGKSNEESAFLLLKNALPSGWLQRRIWTANLAVVKNILLQRSTHRLPQWRYLCRRFTETLNFEVEIL